MSWTNLIKSFWSYGVLEYFQSKGFCALWSKKKSKDQCKTRTAWAVFKYCGTKTVPLRMKNDEKIDLKFYQKKQTN